MWFVGLWAYAQWLKASEDVILELNLRIPKRYADLTQEQFRYVATVIAHERTAEELRTKCWLYFAGLTVKQYRQDYCLLWHGPSRKLCRIATPSLNYFIRQLAWIDSGYTAGVRPLERLCGRKAVYHTFEGVSLAQWLAGENYYQAFLYTRNEDFLRRLCVIVYSPIEGFTDENTEARIKWFKYAKQADMLTVFLYWTGLKQHLAKQYPYFFEQVKGSATSAPNMREYITGIINALDGGDITKDEAVLASDCYRAFATLNAKAREGKEIEERLKKMKR